MIFYPQLPKNSNRSDAPAGLLAEMAKDDKPGGLLGQFDGEQRQEQASNGGLNTIGRLFDPRPAALAAANLILDLSPTHIRPTIDPITRETHWLPIAKGAGDFLSTYMTLPRGMGMGFPGPTASAPVGIVAKPILPPLYSASIPKSDLEDRAYHLPHDKDLGEDPDEGFRRVKDGSKYWFPDAIEPGPLEKIGDDAARRPAASFRNRSYIERVLPDDTILYRVWGGKARKLANWWSRTQPDGPYQVMIDDAVQPDWNDFRQVTSIRVPKGTTVYEGAAERQGNLVGGGWQVYVPEIDPAWELRSWDSK